MRGGGGGGGGGGGEDVRCRKQCIVVEGAPAFVGAGVDDGVVVDGGGGGDDVVMGATLSLFLSVWSFGF